MKNDSVEEGEAKEGFLLHLLLYLRACHTVIVQQIFEEEIHECIHGGGSSLMTPGSLG